MTFYLPFYILHVVLAHNLFIIINSKVKLHILFCVGGSKEYSSSMSAILSQRGSYRTVIGCYRMQY